MRNCIEINEENCNLGELLMHEDKDEDNGKVFVVDGIEVSFFW